jgi:hypothetical protein
VAGWVAISSLATAGGTLALAATTYGSVRSANRAARAAELSLLAGIDAGYISADVLYGDYEGGQRVITRYGIPREEDGVRRPATLRHWQIDRPEPRQRD